MATLQGKTALVTGASRGIGRAPWRSLTLMRACLCTIVALLQKPMRWSQTFAMLEGMRMPCRPILRRRMGQQC